ncbi:F0F1 ATP synthase subunit B [Sporomusa acidovorans]|uniref:ATP synthase subunit b n=1 Tax=Sporomusa acidovorans (strain ATCC 49682 / DSM 3132 / Mol) TaxID=1123286 RepID=A0ABZ3J775_SPOA4|nr:F0F1 ATP synthase subunit B [Sporomusa acidovorans]OZC21186.1 ATP synthase subunit b, sodium ion specific [Sporomusa acidovorans DSM 3132]SDE64124.1 F-type H+-transporting ATPase subunit b [Sporomusa acidovorans]
MVDLNATLIAQIINFLILVAILAKVAYKPLMQALADRQAKIAESLETAEQEKQAAEKLKQEYLAQLAEARTQAQAIVEKAAKLAEQTKEEMLKEAREESARLLKATQEEITREREHAIAELKGEVVTLAVAAASKIIAQNMDEQVNAKIVDEFINNLDGKKIGGLPC